MMVTLRGHMQLETAFRIEPTPLSKKGRVFPSSFLPLCFLNSSRIMELDRNTLQFLSDNFFNREEEPDYNFLSLRASFARALFLGRRNGRSVAILEMQRN